MPVKALKRIADGRAVNLEISSYYKSPRGNIISFHSEGNYYHLHAHGSGKNFFQHAKQSLEQLNINLLQHAAEHQKSVATTGAVVGFGAGMLGGGAGIIVGTTGGLLVGLLGPFALDALSSHAGDMSYVDENGREIYWGPVQG